MLATLAAIAPEFGSRGASAGSCDRHGPVAENGTVDVLGPDVGALDVELAGEVGLATVGAVPAGAGEVVAAGAFVGTGAVAAGAVVVVVTGAV